MRAERVFEISKRFANVVTVNNEDRTSVRATATVHFLQLKCHLVSWKGRALCITPANLVWPICVTRIRVSDMQCCRVRSNVPRPATIVCLSVYVFLRTVRTIIVRRHFGYFNEPDSVGRIMYRTLSYIIGAASINETSTAILFRVAFKTTVFIFFVFLWNYCLKMIYRFTHASIVSIVVREWTVRLRHIRQPFLRESFKEIIEIAFECKITSS